MYLETFAQLQKSLRQLDTWLVQATDYAASRKFDPTVLVNSRLAPDQFALGRQVQIACDTLRQGAARMVGREIAEVADTETTIDELRARVASTLADLATYGAGDFADLSANVVTQPRWQGRYMTAHDFFLEHVLPNFYFHVTTTYAILRHNGVPLGKKDFLGERTMHTP